MPDPSYGLIVEGPYDGPVFEELVHKIIPAAEVFPPIVCGGVPNLKRKFPGWLRYFEHVKQGEPVAKALVIRDSDGKDPAVLEQELAARIEGQTFSFPRGVKFCIIVREMEAWLLADAKAISSVSSLRSGWSVPPVHGELEDIVDPKDRLIRLLSEAKLPYDAEVCREIASRVSIETLKYRCRSFRSFEEKVTDC